MLIRLLGGFSGRERAIKIRGDPPCARCKDEERVIEIARTILGKVRRASRDNELQKNVMPSGSTPLLDNTSSIALLRLSPSFLLFYRENLADNSFVNYVFARLSRIFRIKCKHKQEFKFQMSKSVFAPIITM